MSKFSHSDAADARATTILEVFFENRLKNIIPCHKRILLGLQRLLHYFLTAL